MEKLLATDDMKINYDNLSLHELMSNYLRKHKNKLSFVFADGRLSYLEYKPSKKGVKHMKY